MQMTTSNPHTKIVDMPLFVGFDVEIDGYTFTISRMSQKYNYVRITSAQRPDGSHMPSNNALPWGKARRYGGWTSLVTMRKDIEFGIAWDRMTPAERDAHLKANEIDWF